MFSSASADVVAAAAALTPQLLNTASNVLAPSVAAASVSGVRSSPSASITFFVKCAALPVFLGDEDAGVLDDAFGAAFDAALRVFRTPPPILEGANATLNYRYLLPFFRPYCVINAVKSNFTEKETYRYLSTGTQGTQRVDSQRRCARDAHFALLLLLVTHKKVSSFKLLY